ncbi:hypothetical protein [Arthrobacter sp. STN4]|uniref:hypothetical protein n=1 Tax=Arthrobacter sp. STN4 TaxID=2923276 RepID=UPI00211A4E75|nr:hypothetical protein [Arthrobacter sp. STN4]MCQ9162981.1 hypothetical protein [Arthrobacter sp. STN4]
MTLFQLAAFLDSHDAPPCLPGAQAGRYGFHGRVKILKSSFEILLHGVPLERLDLCREKAPPRININLPPIWAEASTTMYQNVRVTEENYEALESAIYHLSDAPPSELNADDMLFAAREAEAKLDRLAIPAGLRAGTLAMTRQNPAARTAGVKHDYSIVATLVRDGEGWRLKDITRKEFTGAGVSLVINYGQFDDRRMLEQMGVTRLRMLPEDADDGYDN